MITKESLEEEFSDPDEPDKPEEPDGGVGGSLPGLGGSNEMDEARRKEWEAEWEHKQEQLRKEAAEEMRVSE